MTEKEKSSEINKTKRNKNEYLIQTLSDTLKIISLFNPLNAELVQRLQSITRDEE